MSARVETWRVETGWASIVDPARRGPNPVRVYRVYMGEGALGAADDDVKGGHAHRIQEVDIHKVREVR